MWLVTYFALSQILFLEAKGCVAIKSVLSGASRIPPYSNICEKARQA